MNFLSWNVCGLSEMSRKELTGFCRRFKPTILGIIEPRCIFSRISPAVWKGLNLVPIHQNSRTSFRPNIWIFAQFGLGMRVILSTDQVVVVEFDYQGASIKVAVVHGSFSYVLRRQLWIDILALSPGATLVLGDFNAVKGAHERRSPVLPNASACREFIQFIDDAGFIEPTSTGTKFTWSSRRFFPHHTESCLDRALFSEDFANLWFSVQAEVLPRASSDHSPLMVRCLTQAGGGPYQFRFLKMWSSHCSFMRLVTNSWNAKDESRCPIFKVMGKLKRLRFELRKWNREVFKNVDTRLQGIMADLEDVQIQIGNQGYNEDLFNKEVSIQAELAACLNQKDALWRQRSRADWLRDGDRNTSFFHNFAKFKRNKSLITSLEINGNTVHDMDLIADHIVDFFENLFREDRPLSPDFSVFNDLLDASVMQEDCLMLIQVPDSEEIKAIVFDMDPDSVPGPDGFGGAFYTSCWEIIKDDVSLAVQTFFRKGYLPKGLNSSNVVLLPKKEFAAKVSDFRPIVLSNFLYKIISKILANRLGKDCLLHHHS